MHGCAPCGIRRAHRTGWQQDQESSIWDASAERIGLPGGEAIIMMLDALAASEVDLEGFDWQRAVDLSLA
jgi:hypothetical protein